MNWHTFTDDELREMFARAERRAKQNEILYLKERLISKRQEREYRKREQEEALQRVAAAAENKRLLAEHWASVEKANETRARRRAEREARGSYGISERERRSRVRWDDIIDDRMIVERQIKWERRQTALMMRKTGMTLEQVGEQLFVTRERARQLIYKAEQEAGREAPAEQYINNQVTAAATMVKLHNRRAVIKTLEPMKYPGNHDWLLVGSATATFRYGT